MRAAYLDEARQDQVSHVIRDVLHQKGALVRDHSSSRVRFREYKPSGANTWDRDGYVGIYQHEGEKEVEVRLLLRARWPYRILWGVALFNVLAAIATIAINPSGTAWSAIAFVCALALVSAFLLYINTWKPVNREERTLMEDLERAFAQGFEDIETEDEREERLFEESLAGEIESRRVATDRKDEPAAPRKKLALPKPNFSGLKIHRTARPEPADESEAEAKRARIAALRAKVEAERDANAESSTEPSPDEAPARKGLRLPKFGKKALAPPAAPPEDETPEERRARLLARKAELEAQREEK